MSRKQCSSAPQPPSRAGSLFKFDQVRQSSVEVDRAAALAPPPSSATSSPFPRTPASVPPKSALLPRVPARSAHPSDKFTALRRCRSFSFPAPASAHPSRAASRCCAAHGSAEGGPGEIEAGIQRAEGEQQGEEWRSPSGEDRPAEAADLSLPRDWGVLGMSEGGAYVGSRAREAEAVEDPLPRDRVMLRMPEGGLLVGNTAREELSTRLAWTGKSVLQAVCSAVLSALSVPGGGATPGFPSLEQLLAEQLAQRFRVMSDGELVGFFQQLLSAARHTGVEGGQQQNGQQGGQQTGQQGAARVEGYSQGEQQEPAPQDGLSSFRQPTALMGGWNEQGEEGVEIGVEGNQRTEEWAGRLREGNERAQEGAGSGEGLRQGGERETEGDATVRAGMEGWSGRGEEGAGMEDDGSSNGIENQAAQWFSAVQGQIERFQGQVERLQQQIERFQQQDTPLGIKAGKVVAAAAALGFTAAAGVVALRVPDGWEEEMGDGSWKREKEVVETGGSWMVGGGDAGRGDGEGREGKDGRDGRRDGREGKDGKEEEEEKQQQQEEEKKLQQRGKKENEQEELEKGQEGQEKGQEQKGVGGKERGGATRGAEVGVMVETIPSEERGAAGGRKKGGRGELEGSERGVSTAIVPEIVVARKISRRLITDQPAKTMSAVTMQTAAAVKPSAFVGSTSLKASQHKRLQMAVPSRASATGVRCSAVRSERLWTPNSAANSGDIWSIKNDLEVPHSLFMGAPEVMAGQGAPPPMLQERFQSVISQLFQNRIIRCGGAVDDDMANLIVAQLLYLDAVDPTKDIIMYVNSPGGSVTAGMAIFDTMRHIRPDVSTVCVGLAASMGAFLLSAGTKGKRYSLPNSRIMIHQPLGGAQGQQTDIEIQANEILHHKANLNGYLAYHTGQSYDQIVQDTDRDFFMSATEAKEYGLIDAVITNPLKALNAAPVAA
ncbi:unnamed protein product [Closterium sp. Yama58-4]|nr:unnamed protein product [Closterium sp. Yama58-4]